VNVRRIAEAVAIVACAVGMYVQSFAAAQAPPPATPAKAMNYEAEIAKVRPLVGNPDSHDRAMEQLGALSVRAANDLERALALGEAQKVEELDRLIREKLGDTRRRVEQRADEGDADALLAMGMFSARNLLAPRDVEKACEAFVKAAERKHVAGAYQAALCRLKTDPERAAAWMQRAADAGHPAAQEAVGRACLDRKPEPQFECAVRYVTDAARAGRPSAQSLLGWMHVNGTGVSKDPRRASQLYLEAARKRDLAAQNNLGELYEKGAGVVKNERFAFGWYLQAAQAGFAPAQFNLGRLYALGIGVKRDEAKARDWLEKAKRQGIAQADELLRWLAERDAARSDR
jgi:TPR repeat protein